MYDVIPVTTKHSTACGPACLKMLLAYYGVNVDLDTLIDECGVRVNGCTGADLLRVGRAHGLDMTAWRMGANELIQQYRPAIVWWKYAHWVVFCGLNEQGEAVICNPSIGRFPIDTESFSKFYTGVSLWNGTPQSLNEFPADYFGEHEPEPDYFEED